MKAIFRARHIYKGIFLLYLGTSLVSAYGQDLRYDYEPLPRSDKYSWQLIEAVKAHTLNEISKLTFKTKLYYEPGLRISEERIVDRIRDGAYILSDTLQEWVEGIFERIIAANELPVADFLVLISNEPLANAITYNNGVFELSIGLLAMARSDDDLAFVIAHELVHRVNYHVAERTFEYYESRVRDTEKREFSRIVKGRGTLRGLEEVQRKHYQLKRHSREQEIESDTLGLQYMMRAGYDPAGSLNAFAGLGFRFMDNSNPASVLLSQLFTAGYPIKEYWFDQRLNLYNEMPDQVLIFKTDSILTHPDLDLRRAIAADYLGVSLDGTDSVLEMRSGPLMFEAIEGAFESHMLDVCLFLTLQMRLEFPDNTFLVSVISRIFLELYQARYDHTPVNNIYRYVNPYTIDYGPSLTRVNAFLLNLEGGEFLEVGYYFLNNPKTFDPEKEEHYHLLHRLCELTGREVVDRKVRSMYLEKFPEGEYKREMK